MSANKKVLNPMAYHKYWASKPLEPVLEYIEKYGCRNGKPIGTFMLDPFAGSGVIVYAGLLKGFRVIYNDINPFALFLARNLMKPILRTGENGKIIRGTLDDLKKVYNEVLNRELEFNIYYVDDNGDRKVLIPKGVSVREAIEMLYRTSNGELVEYYQWDTLYRIRVDTCKIDEKCDVFLNALLNCIDKCKCIRMIKEYDEKLRHSVEYVEFTYRCLYECFEYIKKGFEKRGVPVNKIAEVTSRNARLVTRGKVKACMRFPVFKKIRGEHKLQELDKYDWELIEKIEKAVFPEQLVFPDNEMKYDKGRIYKKTGNDVFVPSRLSMVEDTGEKIPRMCYYYTKRNLLALSILAWSIMRIEDLELREKFWLVFTKNLHRLAKFDRVGNAGRWAVNSYVVLNDFVERNVLIEFEKAFQELLEIEKQKLEIKEISEKWSEAWSVSGFIDKNAKVLWLRLPVQEQIFLDTLSEFKGKIALVFTDPPYMGKSDAIQYYELSMFYWSWLMLDKDILERYGNGKWYKAEITVNPRQNRTMNLYFGWLEKAFKNVRQLIHDSGVLILTYQSLSDEVKYRLREILLNSGFLFPPEVPEFHEIRRGKPFNATRFGLFRRDAYLVLQPLARKRERKYRYIDVEEFVDKLLEILDEKKILEDYAGVIPKEYVEANIEGLIYNYGYVVKGEDINRTTEAVLKYFVSIGNKYYVLNYGGKSKDELYDKYYSKIKLEELLKRLIISIADANGGVLDRENLFHKEMLLIFIDGRLKEKSDKVGDILVKILNEYFEYDDATGVYKLKKKIAEEKRISKFIPIPDQVINELRKYLMKYGYKVIYYAGRVWARGYGVSSDEKNVLDLIVVDNNNKRYGFIYVTVRNMNKTIRALKTLRKYERIYLICYRDVCRKCNELLRQWYKDIQQQGNVTVVSVTKLLGDIRLHLFMPN